VILIEIKVEGDLYKRSLLGSKLSRFGLGIPVLVVFLLYIVGLVKLREGTMPAGNYLDNRIILYLNGTFCQELVLCGIPLVVLHTISIISFHFWCILGVIA
jgi:hypothetical protein